MERRENIPLSNPARVGGSAVREMDSMLCDEKEEATLGSPKQNRLSPEVENPATPLRHYGSPYFSPYVSPYPSALRPQSQSQDPTPQRSNTLPRFHMTRTFVQKLRLLLAAKVGNGCNPGWRCADTTWVAVSDRKEKISHLHERKRHFRR